MKAYGPTDVLIFGKEMEQVDLLQAILDRADYSSLAESNVETARNVLSTEKFPVVIIVGLGSDGLSMGRFLQEYFELEFAPKIVFISATDDRKQIKDEFPRASFVLMPFTPSQITDLLDQILN